MNLDEFRKKQRSRKKEIKKTVSQLGRTKPKVLDQAFQEAHEAVFACTDCLACANCCTTTGPLFTRTDVDRIARHLRMKPMDFEAEYLRRDEDDDLVLQSVPCRFLESDNRCSIYEVRPKACREYPHTDRDRQHGILNLTEKNAHICPAVDAILERISKQLL